MGHISKNHHIGRLLWEPPLDLTTAPGVATVKIGKISYEILGCIQQITESFQAAVHPVRPAVKVHIKHTATTGKES